MILAGDVGGTKVNLAYFESEEEGLKVLFEKKYKSADYPGLAPIVKDFLTHCPGPVEIATFGIAGPVYEGVCKTPNLPWLIRQDYLEKECGIHEVHMINDLEATAYGIRTLTSEDVVFISKTKEMRPGNAAVIAAGTGLGEAGMFWNGREHIPFATESGHVEFAPRNTEEIELLEFMQTKYERVSYERLVSGNGLVAIYEFLLSKGANASDHISEEMKKEDPAAVITEHALDGSDSLCGEALRLFAKLYGAEAGNLALHHLARGGIYICGGIAPKMLEELKKPGFMEAFVDKGRMKELLESISVAVVLNEKTALQGAAVHASMQRRSH